jgi:hypothetical protein
MESVRLCEINNYAENGMSTQCRGHLANACGLLAEVRLCLCGQLNVMLQSVPVVRVSSGWAIGVGR